MSTPSISKNNADETKVKNLWVRPDPMHGHSSESVDTSGIYYVKISKKTSEGATLEPWRMALEEIDRLTVSAIAKPTSFEASLTLMSSFAMRGKFLLGVNGQKKQC